jgi:hypothetical protein
MFYHDAFMMFLCHNHLEDLVILKLNDIIKDTTSTLSSLCMATTTPQSILSSEASSWNTTHRVITSDSFLVFKENIWEDGLSSQLTYEVNIEDPNYISSLSPNQKLLDRLKMSTETLKKVYGAIMKVLNDLRIQLSTKHGLIAIDHQGRNINTIIAEVQAKCVFLAF